jgi:glycerol kinase
MQIIHKSSDIDDLVSTVKDTGGVYFVTAFSGLLAPYWDSEAGGLLIGISAYTNRAHICRATLEAVSFQVRAPARIPSPSRKRERARLLTPPPPTPLLTPEQTRAILEAMRADSDIPLLKLKVDGGVTNSDHAMQIQADLGGFTVERPQMRECVRLCSLPFLAREGQVADCLPSQRPPGQPRSVRLSSPARPSISLAGISPTPTRFARSTPGP